MDSGPTLIKYELIVDPQIITSQDYFQISHTLRFWVHVNFGVILFYPLCIYKDVFPQVPGIRTQIYLFGEHNFW